MLELRALNLFNFKTLLKKITELDRAFPVPLLVDLFYLE